MKYVSIRSVKFRPGVRKIFSPKWETTKVDRQIDKPINVKKLPKKVADAYKNREEISKQITKHYKTSPLYKKKGVTFGTKKFREVADSDKKLKVLLKQYKQANKLFNDLYDPGFVGWRE